MSSGKEEVGCVNCDRQSPIFEHLSGDELSRINSSRYSLTYQPGELIIKQGAPSKYVVSFTSGLAKIVVDSGATSNMIVKLVRPQEFISGPGLFVNNRHYFSIIAIENSYACAIEADVFKEILQNNHKFNEAYLTYVNNNYLLVLKKLLSSFEKNTRGRVAEALLYLVNDIYGTESFDLTLSVNELASLAGMSKESAFRCIREFTDDDIIRMSKKRIEVLNLELLTEISRRG